MRKEVTRFIIVLSLLSREAAGGKWPSAQLSYPPSGILIVGEGRAANITFNIGGDPFPRERTWYKDGVKISSNSNINIDESGGNLQTLKFNSVSRMNEGTYYMIVEDQPSLQATRSPEVVLKVSYLEDIWDTTETQVVEAKVGEFAVLECRPPDHFGSYIKFSWSKGAERLVEADNIYISEYGDLTILQVSFDYFASDYRCTITIDTLREGYQTKQGPAVQLKVLSNSASYIAPSIAMKPRDLHINAQIKETFRVECVVNGYPNLPSIEWYKDNVRITSSSMIYDLQKRNYLRITIPRSGGTVGGIYRCEAWDGLNRIYTSANIDIYTKPIITTGLPTAEVKKASGSQLSLSCVATSTPVPQYNWYMNARLLSENINTVIKGGSLMISNLNTLNKGVYQCQALNDQGSTISTGKIAVQERLTFVIRPADQEVFLGTSATFNCMGKGDPGPKSLQWQFNGGSPPSTHEYTNNIVNQATYKIPRVTSTERDGRIACIISSPDNLYPVDTATAIITIREGPQVQAHQKNISRVEGESADLACTVQNANVVKWKWLYGGTLLTQPNDRRITINHNLLQLRSLTALDQGSYTCQADEDGLSNQDTIFVKVLTRPKITLDEEVRIGEGSDARLTCEVSGNPTPTIEWRRNGREIRPTDTKYGITSPTSKVTVLTVRQVDKVADIGGYACYGTNNIDTRSKSINLIVVAACEVMEVPRSQTLDYGGSVAISCTVNACPTALWVWKKDGVLVNFDGFRRVDKGDSIELREVVPSDGGVYSCMVDSNNELNNVATYEATIEVQVRARITDFPNNRVLFKSGEEISLVCSAHGDYDKAPLNVEWYKSSISQKSTSEVQKDQNELISYRTERLIISNAIASNAGHYQCIAQNGYNEDRRDSSLMLMTYPDRPGQPYDTWTGAGAIELSWTEPANTGNTPLTSYEIHIESKGNTIFRPFLQGLAPLTVSSVLYFLSENQEYKFKVIAVNDVGKGEASSSSNEIRTFKRLNGNNLNLVEEFTLTAISSDAIEIAWEMPVQTTNALRGYKIVYRNEDKLEEPKFLVIDDYTVLEARIEDLDAGSAYSVQVESNTQVTTHLIVSTVKTTQTFNQRPSAPIYCEADRESPSQIVVTWNQPENTHGKVLGYEIYYKDRTVEDGQWTRHEHKDALTTTYVLTYIDSNADYDVKISAKNSAGEGDQGYCVATGATINVPWMYTWWFYLIIALIGALIIGLLILCVIYCYRRRSEKGPKMQKIPPVGPPIRADEFQSRNAQVYSPNTTRPGAYNPNPMNTFSGGQGPDPYAADKFGGQDFRFGAQPKSDYGYNPNKLGNTFDSRYEPGPKSPGGGAFYEPPKPAFDPPTSPAKGYGGYGDTGSNYDNTSKYDNNTFDSRYYKDRPDTSSRGYPTYDRNAPSYGGGAGAGANFKSSQL